MIEAPPASTPARRTVRAAAWRRVAPTVVAAALALAYVLVSPPSEDLSAHLLRAKLFATTGFGLWNNWWYAGHHTPGYSVLFPAVAALVTPQVAAALAAVATAAAFEALSRRHFGAGAWVSAVWFGAATAVDLFTGRLTFAFGLLPAVGMALALQRRRDGLAVLLAFLTPLASPVAALFAALAAGVCAVARSDEERRGRVLGAPLLAAAAALIPVLGLAVAFPEGGSEPYARSTLWPIVIIGAAMAVALGSRSRALLVGVLLYVFGNVLAYLLVTPVGSNASRLEPLLAGPLAALIWWPRRRGLLVLVAVPLLYLQWQAPVRDVRTSWNDPATTAAYYEPLVRFLERQPGPPFRIEIPFTLFHWEAFEVAPRIPLARGWERQVDTRDNRLFYGERLTAATYRRWLGTMGVRFVAVARGPVDYSARAELALIDGGLPYLRLVMATTGWRVYAVQGPTPLADGPAVVTALEPNSLTLRVRSAGSVYVRVHFSPYWALTGVPGCVVRAGDFTRLRVRRPGTARLVMRFALGRIAATSPRCS